jgi:hypothetical protein
MELTSGINPLLFSSILCIFQQRELREALGGLGEAVAFSGKFSGRIQGNFRKRNLIVETHTIEITENSEMKIYEM